MRNLLVLALIVLAFLVGQSSARPSDRTIPWNGRILQCVDATHSGNMLELFCR